MQYFLLVENSYGVMVTYQLPLANKHQGQEFVIKNGSNAHAATQVYLTPGDFLDNSQNYINLQPLTSLRVVSLKDTRDSIWKWWSVQ